MDKQVRKPAWLVALWAMVPIAICLVITAFTAVAIIGFQWGLLLTVFRVWWLAFLLIMVFVYVIVFLATKYPLGTVSIGLLTIAAIFILASLKENDMAQQLNSAIYSFVDVNLLVGAFTISAFVLAFFAIYKEREGN